MQQEHPPLTLPKSPLDIVELLSVIGAVGGAAASIVFQQTAIAAIPLSLAVALRFQNQKHQLQAVLNHTTQELALAKREVSANAHIDAWELATEFKRASISHTDAELAKARMELTADYRIEAWHIGADLKHAIHNANAQIEVLSQAAAAQKQIAVDLSEVMQQAQTLTATAESLRVIQNATQTILTEAGAAENAHFERGFNHQALGDRLEAIQDFTEVIRLNENNARAYYHRGVLLSSVGDKQGAVQDLRASAKLSFEQGDLKTYQEVRDMSKQLLNDAPEEAEAEAPRAIALPEDSNEVGVAEAESLAFNQLFS
jgi:tetratricopeptide (TPR) repeat protein